MIKKLFLLTHCLLIISCASTLSSTERQQRESASEAASEALTSWSPGATDLKNNHNYTSAAPLLNRSNVKNLKVKWVKKTRSNVGGTPTVDKGVVYYTVSAANADVKSLIVGGQVEAVDAASGKLIWSKSIRSYTDSTIRSSSRSSPAVSGDKIIIGDSFNNTKFLGQITLSGDMGPNGASLIAINRHNGEMIWKTEIEPHKASRITMSPVIFEDQVIVGVSSIESEIPGVPVVGGNYKCCSFRGSLVSVDINTGKINWKTYTIDIHLVDFSGAPVWGSSPPIDVNKRRIFIGTGNNYHTSQNLENCIAKAKSSGESMQTILSSCAKLHDRPNNRFDSIMALNVDTGEIVWTKKTLAYDSWNVSCGSEFVQIPIGNKQACPNPEGPDGDFAQAPMLIKPVEGLPSGILVVGQKNGSIWGINPDNGETIWKTSVGPGGKLGGHQWGAATDGKYAFFQTTNLEHKTVAIKNVNGVFTKTNGGFWSAIDVKDGRLIWQRADPNSKQPLKGQGIFHPIYGFNLGLGFFAAAMGPITYYNGLLFAGSLAGTMHALNSDTGEILWSKKVKGSVVSSPYIVNDTLYWGTGYHMGFSGDELFSLGL